MTAAHNGAGDTPAPPTPTPAPSGVVRVGDRDVRVERITGLKLSRSLAIIRAIGRAVPDLVTKWGKFRQEYEQTHSVELDRATALMRFGPQPLANELGELERDEAGNVRMMPGRLEHLTEEDWNARGNVLRIPASPSTGESIAAILPDALDVAEEHVYRLVALLTLPNQELARVWRTGALNERLDELVDELLAEAYADELLELAVVCGEVLDDQFRRKTSELSGRLGNALRLFGLDPTRLAPATPQSPTTSEDTSTTSPSSSKPSSSSDSPSSTDGPPTPPSAPLPTSSKFSDDATENAPTMTPSESSPPAEVLA